MRFTDGRENLEINIHEGQHGYDMTAVFFGNTPAHDENGIHHIESVRALLKDTLDRVLGLSGHPVPEEDTCAIYAITNMAGETVKEGSARSSDIPDNMYCSGCGCLLTEENENPCGDTGWCEDCY